MSEIAACTKHSSQDPHSHKEIPAYHPCAAEAPLAPSEEAYKLQDPIHDIVTPYAPTRVLRSKDSEKLIVPKARLKTVGDRAFASAAPSLWNALPNELRVNSRSLSLECLKKMIKGSSLLLYMTEIKLNERL